MSRFVDAFEHMRAGRLAEAEAGFREVLSGSPEDANALQFLGVTLASAGRPQEALPFIERALALRPDQPVWINNRGKVLMALGRTGEAIAAYRAALAAEPQQEQARQGLAVGLLAAGRKQEAEAAFRAVLEVAPGHANAHGHLADILFETGRPAEGVEHLEQAITLAGGAPGARREMLVRAFLMLGAFARAGEALGAWLEAEPENARALHLRSALGGAPAPERASDAYVSDVFDSFADSFESRLAQLDYQAPEHVARGLAARAGGRRLGAVLDAGCGTGLCAPLLAPLCAALDGVDLSGGMLAHARGRGIYRSLAQDELTAFLVAHPAAYEAVVSADTLVYFGALEAVCAATHAALTAGGILVATIEADEDGDDGAGFRLCASGRYAHRPEYVRRCLADAGFADAAIERVTLRSEGGRPVAGFLVSAVRAG